MAAAYAKRFQRAVEEGEDPSKMKAILQMAGNKNELMAWKDEQGLDLLHHCILQNRAEVVDLLLKGGYFARPHEPDLNPYTHLASLLGFRSTLNVLLQHRPDDFRIAAQPLYVPPDFTLPSAGPSGPSAVSGGRRSGPTAQKTRETSAAAPAATAPAGTGRFRGSAAAVNAFLKLRRNLGVNSMENGPLKGKRLSKGMVLDLEAMGTRSLLSRNEAFQAKRGQAVRQDEAAKRRSATVTNSTGQVTRSKEGASLFQDDGLLSSTKGKGSQGSAKPLDGLTTDGSKPLQRTPLDVAARAQRLDCVRFLLDAFVLKKNPDAPNKGYLTLAALGDCPSAVKLVLENSKPDKQTMEDFKAAVEICVQRAHPECLDLLLSNGPGNMDTKSLFKQINFYHVLYTFSASRTADQKGGEGGGGYGRLPEVTRVLIRRGHDVNVKLPPRTYPLYTLLTHAFCFHDYSYTRYYIECLRLLLAAGADPNFDEVEFEKRLQRQRTTKVAAGRGAHSSALHCLLDTVETYASQVSSPALAVRFIVDCTEILVKHRADMAKVGRIGGDKGSSQGNMLHQYAKSCVTLGVDTSILRCILRFGGEPDVKVDGKYAVNVYFDKLFELFTSYDIVDTRHKCEDDVNTILTFLCRYMTPAHIKEAALIFKQSHGRSRSEQVKYYIPKVLEDLEARSKRVRPLQGLAAWRVWKLCGKRAEVVRNLPVKVELKTLILPVA